MSCIPAGQKQVLYGLPVLIPTEIYLHLVWRRFSLLVAATYDIGIRESVCLEINSLGLLPERAAFIAALKGFLEKYQNDLDPDSQRRLSTNPLRILDSKEEILTEEQLIIGGRTYTLGHTKNYIMMAVEGAYEKNLIISGTVAGFLQNSIMLLKI